MREQQLHLFDPARPLLERFGREFFRAVPPRPGVYIMGGEAERVLYIGQSGNLRHRLGSYKNARVDRAPRKVIRLVHLVRTIVWEECATAEAARLKENQLLRVHRPRFNVQNTYPRAYQFIGLRGGGDRLAICLANEILPEGKTFGAFKSGCRAAHGALLRLIWAALHQPGSPHDFPAPLLGFRAPQQYQFERSSSTSENELKGWKQRLETFFAGESDELIGALRQMIPKVENICPFQRGMQMNDLEVLEDFFERGPKRNHALRTQYGICDRIISQEELDDLLAVGSRGDAGQKLFEDDAV